MNIILLTPEEVNLHTKRAYIHHPKHVHHIKTVLQAQVGDCLKIGMLGGKMGSALIESIGDVVCLNECLSYVAVKPPTSGGGYKATS